MYYLCEICGYPYLTEPPYDNYGYGRYVICPCCGFESGYDDYPDKQKSYETWRKNWIAKGYPWFSKNILPPRNWNPEIQLKKLLKQGY